jgi:VanZ family protein
VPQDPAAIWHRCLATPFYDNGSDQRPDWIANLLLMVPLGLLCAGTFGAGRSLNARVAGDAFALLTCFGFVLTVKYLQLFLPPRTVSLNYIIAQSIGVAVGVGLFQPVRAVAWRIAAIRLRGRGFCPPALVVRGTWPLVETRSAAGFQRGDPGGRRGGGRQSRDAGVVANAAVDVATDRDNRGCDARVGDPDRVVEIPSAAWLSARLLLSAGFITAGVVLCWGYPLGFLPAPAVLTAWVAVLWCFPVLWLVLLPAVLRAAGRSSWRSAQARA